MFNAQAIFNQYSTSEQKIILNSMRLMAAAQSIPAPETAGEFKEFCDKMIAATTIQNEKVR